MTMQGSPLEATLILWTFTSPCWGNVIKWLHILSSF